MTPSLKAIMDDMTVLTKTIYGAKAVLERLGYLIKWSRMNLKTKKSISCTIANDKQKKVRFMIAGENIPTVKEEPGKSLGTWYKDGLTDRHKGVEIYHQAQDR